jgi:hypothetical protein
MAADISNNRTQFFLVIAIAIVILIIIALSSKGCNGNDYNNAPVSFVDTTTVHTHNNQDGSADSWDADTSVQKSVNQKRDTALKSPSNP